MDSIINQLREDAARAQAAKAVAIKDVSEAQRDTERRVAIVQEALEAERATKHRLHEELRNKEQLSAELQGTLRLLQSRVHSKEDDLRRLDHELQDSNHKLNEVHSLLGRREATIGQLNAKLRVFESRGSL